MAYTDIDNPELYFQAKAWTGTGNEIAITFDGSENMQPDWVWLKRRDASSIHVAHDSVRGATKRLIPNANDGETTQAQYVKSFDSNGITFGTDTDVNNSGSAAILWGWKAGTSFSNDASSTSIGSIDSAGSINTTAGFSIVTFTGNSGGIAHGLGQKPDMVIIKPRNVDGSWIVTHKGLGAEMQDYYQFLDTTAARATSNDIWGGEPTTTTFSVSSSLIDSANYVAYCFAEKKGYSKFGSYTGNNNANGTFVYTGFKPAYVMTKVTDTTDGWMIFDNKRNPHNVMDKYMTANGTGGDSTRDSIDFVSNGFKLRVANTDCNNGTYIYMAFAEQPFVTSTGVPATAR